MVDNVNGINGMGGVQPPRRTKTTYRMSDVQAASDSVEFSSDVMRLQGVEGVRMDRVLAVRSQIAAGNYFNADKLDQALDRAIDDVFGKLFPAK